MSLAAFEPVSNNGFVYLVKSGQHHKVGLTTGDVKSRIANMQTGNPVPIEIVDFFPTSQPYEDESNIHAILKRYWVQGEWFLIPDEVIAARETWFKSGVKHKPKPKIAIPVDFNITEADARRITEVVAEESRKSSEISRRNIIKSLLTFAKSEMSPEEYAKVERQFQ